MQGLKAHHGNAHRNMNDHIPDYMDPLIQPPTVMGTVWAPRRQTQQPQGTHRSHFGRSLARFGRTGRGSGGRAR